MNTSARWLPLVGLVIFVSACGGGKPPCGPATCAGCCDASGACQDGWQQGACGSSGQSCLTCETKAVCQLGQCVRQPGGCTAKTCQSAGKDCGSLPDGCGGTLSCGSCTAPKSCGGGGEANVCGAGTCVPKSCAQLGKSCGTVSDGCGGTVDCGTCTAPQTCGGGGTPNVCGGGCSPKTCGQLGKNCGSAPDGCGGSLDCGSCASPQTCGGGGVPNVCGMGMCTPKTCAEQGKACGTSSDGCSATLNCGTCTAPQTCGGGGTPNVCGCAPKTCAEVGKSCGPVPDGCGGTLSCTCTAPQTCGGGGAPDVCGCTPKTCTQLGNSCGALPDGCGGTVTCSCPSPQTCGGGGTANVCGCTPKTCTQLGKNCGSAPDGCGGTLSCGTCTAPQTCGGGGTANLCGCAPKTCAQLGKDCGSVADGCGGTLSCGSCAAPQTCGGGGTANVCGCPPRSCAELGKNCGTSPDGCGGMVSCGTCTAPQSCGAGGVPNVCGCAPTTCAALGKNCGQVPNGCGGTLNCGACATPLTCGGAGVPNTCGLGCALGCPTGWSCTGGVCAGGNLGALTLDVKGPVRYRLSGSIKRNGAAPVGSCQSGRQLAVVLFENTSNSALNTQAYLSSCGSGGAVGTFTYSEAVHAGTYRVYVRGDSSNLPSFDSLVYPALSVQGSGQVDLNVLTTDVYSVSGAITLNGAAPTATCDGFPLATVTFKSAVDPRLDARVEVNGCASGGTPSFSYQANLKAGSYAVSVTGEGASSLPKFKSQVMSTVTISSGSTLNLNVVTPPRHSVSGSITLNGAAPSGVCSGTALAYVNFVHATDSRYDASLTLPGCSALGTPNFQYSTQLYAGTYKVSVAGGRSNLPRQRLVVNPALSVTGPTVAGLDVKSQGLVAVSGKVTVNGVVPFTSCLGAGTTQGFVLFDNAVDPAKNASATIWGCPLLTGTPELSYSGYVEPGTYKVSVRAWSEDMAMPTGSGSDMTVLPAQALTAATSLPLNVVLPARYTFSGAVLKDGAAPTATCNWSSPAVVTFAHQGDPRLTSTFGIPSCSPGGTPSFSLSQKLYAGDYKVSVKGSSPSNLPLFEAMTPATLTVQGSLSSNIDVVTTGFRTVAGTLTLNGGTPSLSCDGIPLTDLTFTHVSDPRLNVWLELPGCPAGGTPSFAFSVVLAPGTYAIDEWANSNSNFPAVNTRVVEQLVVP